MAYVPDSLPESSSQDFDATQVDPTQPVYSQPSQAINSQIEPRRKYWAILIPINPAHSILKLPWSRPRLQIGRGSFDVVGNHVVIHEKRVSNRHCVISLFPPRPPGEQVESEAEMAARVERIRMGSAEPEVWIEDLKSSNGTFLNGTRINPRRMLSNGDEISLGHQSTAEHHDVRYIFRSVGRKDYPTNMNSSRVTGKVYERYQMLESLGKGTFAEVKKAVDVETGDLRAIKQIVKHRFDHNEKTLNLFQREIDICLQLHHENICRMIDWYSDPQHICLVLEYIDGGDLLDYIMKYPDPGLPEQDAAELTFQICRAMAYCHENKVTHRDLKPENILLTKETETQPLIIKIADFGLAKMVHTQTMLTSMVGTPQYLAPEVVMQTKSNPGYENVVDSWSVGIIVYSMLTKALPFDDAAELSIEQRIRQRYEMAYDRQPLYDLNVSDAAIDFITRLLDPEPTMRMTLTEALDHEWLAGPSSLPNESPSQVLGGDSMWNIQAFESANDVEEEGPRDRTWSRPMTASTNFDLSGTGDSFSQPMEGLRLESKQAGNLLSPAKEEDESDNGDDLRWQSPDTTVEDVVGQNGNGHVVNAANGAATSSGMDVDSAPPSSSSGMDVDSVSVGSKRKLDTSFFSSGSLSPPPEERCDRETTPKPRKSPEEQTTPGAAPRRLTRAATAKAASPTKTRTRGVTTSPNAPRPRKSKRLG